MPLTGRVLKITSLTKAFRPVLPSDAPPAAGFTPCGQVSASIVGTIAWMGLWLPPAGPAADLATVNAALGIGALRIIPPPAGSPPVWGNVARPVGDSSVTSCTVRGDHVLVDYLITGIPLGQQLIVQVVPGGPFILATDTDAEFVIGQQHAGPARFTLTSAEPSQTCDFNVITAPIPR